MGDHRQGTQTWIDAVATPFDRAWMAGRRPRIEDYLSGVEQSRRPPLLGELLRIELEYRRKAGEAPTREEYERRFAGDAGVVRAACAGHETIPPPPGTTTPPASSDPPAPGRP